VFLGIANCSLATPLRPPSPLVGLVDIKEAEQQLASKRASVPDDALLLQTSKEASELDDPKLNIRKTAREGDIALVRMLHSLWDPDDQLMKGIDTNRWVLYLAALSSS